MRFCKFHHLFLRPNTPVATRFTRQEVGSLHVTVDSLAHGLRVVEAEAVVGLVGLSILAGVGDELDEEGGDVGGGDTGGGEHRAAEPPVVGVEQPVRRAIIVAWNRSGYFVIGFRCY